MLRGHHNPSAVSCFTKAEHRKCSFNSTNFVLLALNITVDLHIKLKGKNIICIGYLIISYVFINI